MEIYQPKSIFAYKEDLTIPDGQLIFGPLWDFDWAYGGGGNRTDYWINPTEYAIPSWANKGPAQFRNDMKSMGVVQYHYYKIWADFMNNGSLDELCEFVRDYYNFSQASFKHNASRWDDGNGYESDLIKIERWLRTRADYLFAQQPTFDITDYDDLVEGDVNGDGRVTVTDAFLVFSYLMGDELDDFDERHSDVNHDQKTNIADVTCIVRRALTATPFDGNYAAFQTPAATASLNVDTFEAPLGEWIDIPVGLTFEENTYQALQFDVALPEGLALDSVIIGKEPTNAFTLNTQALGDNCTRIMLMPLSSNAVLSTQPVTLRIQSIKTTAAMEHALTLRDGYMTTASGHSISLIIYMRNECRYDK